MIAAQDREEVGNGTVRSGTLAWGGEVGLDGRKRASGMADKGAHVPDPEAMYPFGIAAVGDLQRRGRGDSRPARLLPSRPPLAKLAACCQDTHGRGADKDGVEVERGGGEEEEGRKGQKGKRRGRWRG